MAPFVFHTYKTPYPKWQTWTPLSAEDRQQITANLPRCSITELSEEGSSCYNQQKVSKGKRVLRASAFHDYLFADERRGGGCEFWHHFRPDIFAPSGGPPLLALAQYVMRLHLRLCVMTQQTGAA